MNCGALLLGTENEENAIKSLHNHRDKTSHVVFPSGNVEDDHGDGGDDGEGDDGGGDDGGDDGGDGHLFISGSSLQSLALHQFSNSRRHPLPPLVLRLLFLLLM